ncbi:MAG: 2-C-methyl-D-erythritol 4-phosphate cytidylyltransferase [Thermodesulfobacteriota bacterium]
MGSPAAMEPAAGAIIVAGGSGLRMGREIRKQYLPVAGIPIVAHTLRAFCGCGFFQQVVLVVPASDFDFCRTNIIPFGQPPVPILLAVGGGNRQDSVFAGLAALPRKNGVVVIHDAVRPFVRRAEISACIDGARKNGACILGLPVVETLKQAPAGIIRRTIDRNGIWMAQTPQAFQYDLIQKAHEAAKQEGFEGTDDASLLERLGHPVHIIPGSRVNIKITTPEDLTLAEVLFPAFRPE